MPLLNAASTAAAANPNTNMLCAAYSAQVPMTCTLKTSPAQAPTQPAQQQSKRYASGACLLRGGLSTPLSRGMQAVVQYTRKLAADLLCQFRLIAPYFVIAHFSPASAEYWMTSDAPIALTNAKAATAPPLSYKQHTGNTAQHTPATRNHRGLSRC